jgi:hypothetical protein
MLSSAASLAILLPKAKAYFSSMHFFGVNANLALHSPVAART